MNIWPFKKQQPKKTWKATAKGYYPVGLGCCEVYFNLFEDEKGKRSYTEQIGREYLNVPAKADFSAKTQVEAWTYSNGAYPRCLFDPFENMETL